MTIKAIVGGIGSGKSYEAVKEVIVPAMREGRFVATNINLSSEGFAKLGVPFLHIPLDLDVPTCFNDAINEAVSLEASGLVFVIDEIWRRWPAGLRVEKALDQDKAFLAENRHVIVGGLSLETVLIVQDLSNVAAFVRSLVQETQVCKKHTELGFRSSYRVEIYEGPQRGLMPPIRARVRIIHRRYDKKFFPLYRSHTQVKSGDTVKEVRIDNRGVIWKSPYIWLGAPLSLLLIFYGIYRLQSLGRSVSQPPSSSNQATIPGATIKGTPSSNRNTTPRGVDDYKPSAWFITGSYSKGKDRIFLLSDPDGRVIKVDQQSCRGWGLRPYCQAPDGAMAYEGRLATLQPVSSILPNARP